jgi:pimeloyl-ACP methyl ester carboxylesterase
MVDFAIPETRYTRSGDVNIAYQVVGEGPIDILIVPGAISHGELVYELPGCARFVERLSRFARVIGFDKRGQGLSDRVAGVPALEERMDDVRAVMDAAGSRSTVLMGFSEGCPMSVLFAATNPERVSHLVLIGGFARSGSSMPQSQFDAFVYMVVANWGTGQMMKRAVGTADDNKEELAKLGKFERMSCSPGSFKTLLLMNRRIDVTSIFPSVRVPTLVLHSRADAVVPLSEGQKLAAAIPGAKYVEYADLPHLCWSGDCQQLIGDIEEFVAGHRVGDAVDADRVLATVLFTDIVNSTDRAVKIGDRRWRELLDSHDRLARQTVERHRGRLVKSTGDGPGNVRRSGPRRSLRVSHRSRGPADRPAGTSWSTYRRDRDAR